jgi:hypothetical protein
MHHQICIQQTHKLKEETIKMETTTTNFIYFGMSAAAGMIAWFTIFAIFIWPKMKKQPLVQKLRTLTAIHFFRYFGTTFLMVGLVTRKLPVAFADPAAFGDVLALILAYVAFVSLRYSRNGKPYLLPFWIFNILGTADLLLAFVTGPLLLKNVANLGVAYLIPTLYVPLLFVAHFYAFRTLIQRSPEAKTLL